MDVRFGPRRGRIWNVTDLPAHDDPLPPLDGDALARFEDLDLVYRSLCALMYNFVPKSGHPGGSISSGRIVQSILFDVLDYDISDPEAAAADQISYAAGHKALGLYAIWALRDEAARAARPELLPDDARRRLRLEDLLGFRRNPTSLGPLAREFGSKALDGHPTPATPFVRLSTGASGVGVASSFGLALGLLDVYGADAPRVHVIEGEGGLTPGRVAESLAAAGTMGLRNIVLHIDWNQASIDSDRVCRDGELPGEYVQWDPVELCYLHDWNVIVVPDGFDLRQIQAAQRFALTVDNGQPTAIVYRTIKGWKYGIEGRKSHGAGHDLCAEPFYQAVAPLLERIDAALPTCERDKAPCGLGAKPDVVERCYWDALQAIRSAFEPERNPGLAQFFADRLAAARERLAARGRAPRNDAPRIEVAWDIASGDLSSPPEDVRFEPGSKVALRAALGKTLGHYNRATGGAVLAAAADLLGSTSVNAAAEGFPAGFFHASANPGARLLSIGGICEDAICGMLTGVAACGRHLPAASSYGAFIAPLGHIAARLHGIASQARQEIAPEPYRTFILVCAHAGLKTGEDGPTHADPQPLQLLEENFPRGVLMTATPWEPQEVWPLIGACLARRPAVLAPFVTRPAEPVLDRPALGLAPAEAAVSGVYELLAPDAGRAVDATVVLQGSEVTYAFVQEALPLLRERGLNVRAYYVASAELFDSLPESERERIFPSRLADEAMGITGFTLPTMYRWIRSERGRAHTLHPYRNIGYPGSGHGASVLRQAGLDGASQADMIERFARG
ncbi:MAG: transketolase [Acidobacteriota bacterium]